MKTIETDKAPAAIGPYSQAVEKNGVVEVAGQIGLTPDGELVSGVEAQTKQALENVENILHAANASWYDVVKVRVYLANMEDYDTVNRIYDDALWEHKPARVVVQVSKLPKNALIEVDATAITD